MFEFMRKLTADYTEAEYDRYLWCEGLDSWVNMDADRDKWYYAKNLKYTGFKDVAVDLVKVSNDTGYDYDELCDLYTEKVRDGDSLEEAMEYIAGVSYEHDW